ncbi:MAG TPA: hypothetical protein VNF74_08515 [Terriglobales bacterium]|nr:hypothetical protein [Terriglobales bacterium]
MAESEFAFHVGVDWGAEQHQVCILDAAGEAVEGRAAEPRRGPRQR